jgi:hypothetical protein
VLVELVVLEVELVVPPGRVVDVVELEEVDDVEVDDAEELEEVLVDDEVEVLVELVEVEVEVDEDVEVLELVEVEVVDEVAVLEEVVELEVVEVVEVLVDDVEVVVVVVVWTSTEPMSHAGPAGRGNPRWSVAGHPGPVAVSMTGLPVIGTHVLVCPPLKVSGASSGSFGLWSPVAPSPQVVSSATLYPSEATPPLQLPAGVAAMIEPRSVTVPPSRSMEAPVDAVFLNIVVWISETLPPRCTSPPPEVALLPPKVLLVNVAVAELSSPPPDPPWASFASRVTPVAVSVPETFAMPPPSTARLLRNQTSVRTATPSLRSPPPVVVMPGAAAMLSWISLPNVPPETCRVAVTAL